MILQLLINFYVLFLLVVRVSRSCMYNRLMPRLNVYTPEFVEGLDECGLHNPTSKHLKWKY